MNRVILFISVCIFLGGCTRTKLYMTSSPSKAEVMIGGRIARVTPFELNYSNIDSRPLMFTVRKTGFKVVKGVTSPDGGDFHINLESGHIESSLPIIMTVEELLKNNLQKKVNRNHEWNTKLMMKSEPNDAQVVIGNKVIGYTPFIYSYGNGRIRDVEFTIRRDSFKSFQGIIPPKGGIFDINLTTQEIVISPLPKSETPKK